MCRNSAVAESDILRPLKNDWHRKQSAFGKPCVSFFSGEPD